MRLLLASLLLLLPSVAGAEEDLTDLQDNFNCAVVHDKDHPCPGYPKELGITATSYEESGNYQADLDRFLAEKVQPEIALAELNYSKNRNLYQDAEQSIAHYLKALVLIEQEKLRRQK